MLCGRLDLARMYITRTSCRRRWIDDGRGQLSGLCQNCSRLYSMTTSRHDRKKLRRNSFLLLSSTMYPSHRIYPNTPNRILVTGSETDYRLTLYINIVIQRGTRVLLDERGYKKCKSHGKYFLRVKLLVPYVFICL